MYTIFEAAKHDSDDELGTTAKRDNINVCRFVVVYSGTIKPRCPIILCVFLGEKTLHENLAR